MNFLSDCMLVNVEMEVVYLVILVVIFCDILSKGYVWIRYKYVFYYFYILVNK